MSLNIVFAQSTNEMFPLPLQDEVFILKRQNISFLVKDAHKNYAGSGIVFLTNQRLVILDSKKSSKSECKSIQLLFSLVEGVENKIPEFQQPIFGANFLEGTVKPETQATYPLKKKSLWKLIFKKGGCQTFISTFYVTFKHAKNNSYSQRPPPFMQQVAHGGIQQSGLYDPTDPSTFFVTQPAVNPSIYSSNAFVSQPVQQQQSPLYHVPNTQQQYPPNQTQYPPNQIQYPPNQAQYPPNQYLGSQEQYSTNQQYPPSHQQFNPISQQTYPSTQPLNYSTKYNPQHVSPLPTASSLIAQRPPPTSEGYNYHRPPPDLNPQTLHYS